MASLYTNQKGNIYKTWALMATFFVFIILLGFGASYYFDSPVIFYGAFFVSIALNITSYWYSDSITLSMTGAHPVTKEEQPELYTIVENLCITAGLPMPKIYVIDDPAPNAFATGRNPEHAAVAVTSGLLPLLNKSELEGVIAHELSHVGNRDTLVMTVAVVLAGMVAMASNVLLRANYFGGKDNDNKGNVLGLVLVLIGTILAPIAATLIQLAISRKREFLADASGALLTRYPEGLASALQKISSFTQPMKLANNATAHLFIANPMGHALADDGHEEVSWVTRLFMTHPPVGERVEALLGKKE